MVAFGNGLQDASHKDGITPWVAGIIKPVGVAEIASERWHLAINCKTPVMKAVSPLG
jgi:hypothetical protein